MGKFLIPFLHSLLSLLITMGLIQLFLSIVNEETVSNIFIDMIQIPVVVIGIGTPVVLVGCVLGELLFRYFILLFHVNYIISLVLYVLLAVGVLLVFGFVLTGGIQNVFEDVKSVTMTIICSVTFFVSRNRYEKKT
ncbi:hypothetical protein [Bacillus sp. H1a]|uniref:hypothetical protein n=1 Tax=Bacillus sp. H1a TaxID=1397276 RepID=UPI00046A9693|nr:hypothetical protein [Bacillus sp. H1a]